MAIVSGPLVTVSEDGEEGFAPSFAQTVICQGNLLFISWRHDPVAGPTNIWFTYTYLDAPSLPTESVQLPTATLSPTATVSLLELEPIDVDFEVQALNTDSMGSSVVLFLSIAPAIILIALILIVKRNKR